MKKLFEKLPDEIFLSQVNIPGTHDSCTAFCTMENVSRCQSLTVRQQLEAGIRLFDIRLYKKGNEFYLCHALADCFCDSEKKKRLTFGEVLKDFKSFIRENPEEVLVVSIKQDRGIMSRRFFPAFYSKYIKGNESEWFLKNENPTLADCRGKMVLMRRCKVHKSFARKNDAGLDFSYWKDQDGKKKTHPLPVYLNGETLAMVQDRYGLEPNVKWKKCEKPFLDSCKCDINNMCVHFMSTAYRYKNESLVKTAEEMNNFFKGYNLEEGKGWFFFDFPNEEILKKFYVKES